MEIKV
jgi:hypothetical protein